jgi:hypothetical protein
VVAKIIVRQIAKTAGGKMGKVSVTFEGEGIERMTGGGGGEDGNKGGEGGGVKWTVKKGLDILDSLTAEIKMVELPLSVEGVVGVGEAMRGTDVWTPQIEDGKEGGKLGEKVYGTINHEVRKRRREEPWKECTTRHHPHTPPPLGWEFSRRLKTTFRNSAYLPK